MAERRMFSKEIVSSDAFLDMSQTTQNLYFHLGMNADDEGFISSPRTVLRMIGANANDLDLLLAKRYAVGFDSGIVVIKHWKLNNQMRKDRVKDTVYLEEKNMLQEKENGVYSLISNDYEVLQPTVNQVSTKCPPSIGEVRVGEDSIQPLKKPAKIKIEPLDKNGFLVDFSKWTNEDLQKNIKLVADNKPEYTKDMLINFYKYWIAKNKKGVEIFKKERSWSTASRLSTWFNNQKK